MHRSTVVTVLLRRRAVPCHAGMLLVMLLSLEHIFGDKLASHTNGGRLGWEDKDRMIDISDFRVKLIPDKNPSLFSPP
jgi:hypothetical protein